MSEHRADRGHAASEEMNGPKTNPPRCRGFSVVCGAAGTQTVTARALVTARKGASPTFDGERSVPTTVVVFDLPGKHFLCSLPPVVMEEAWPSMHPVAVSPAEGSSRLRCEARVIKLMRRATPLLHHPSDSQISALDRSPTLTSVDDDVTLLPPQLASSHAPNVVPQERDWSQICDPDSLLCSYLFSPSDWRCNR
ncbi:unnamed protein product [Lampetra planeri]